MQKAFGKKIRILLDKLKAVREYCETNQCFGSFWHKAVGKSLISSFTREISRKKIHSYARLKTKGHWHQLRAIVKISENHPNYCHNSDEVRIFRDRAGGDPMEIFSQLPPETETSILETVCFVQLRSPRKQLNSGDRVSLLYKSIQPWKSLQFYFFIPS